MYLDALDFLDEERDAFRPFEALADLTDDQLSVPVEGAHGWSGRQLMGHLLSGHEVAVAVATELAVNETSPAKERADADWDTRGGEVVNAEIDARGSGRCRGSSAADSRSCPSAAGSRTTTTCDSSSARRPRTTRITSTTSRRSWPRPADDASRPACGRPYRTGSCAHSHTRPTSWVGVRGSRLRGAPPEGESMAKIVVTAAVKDVEAWLKFKPEMVAQMAAVASDGTSYVAMDGSNQVASTWDVPDMAAFQAAQTAVSPEMAEAMERYGMIPPVTIYIEK